LGKMAAANLIQMIKGEIEEATYEFAPELTERESVKKLNE